MNLYIKEQNNIALTSGKKFWMIEWTRRSSKHEVLITHPFVRSVNKTVDKTDQLNCTVV